MTKSKWAAWLAMLSAMLMAIGSGVAEKDLHTLFGAHTDAILAAARVLAALVAAVTGSIVVRRNA